ncbi:MAG TPA: DUF58 domain-containing protein [Alphaproteobacteria bacterium]|nr:DUF58 domain-containing protein [Alphaproteobacteria bacterium]
MASPSSSTKQPPKLTAGQSALQRAEETGGALPPLLVAAERVANTVAQGVHGRRRVGQGDAFWQFRPYQVGDTTTKIDWRQTAKTQHVFIRENEWEAAQSVWLWRDDSPSMRWRSNRNLPEKAERAELLLLALANILMRGGERVALLGAGYPPSVGRATMIRMAETLARGGGFGANAPTSDPLPRHAHVVLLSDFLGPIEEIEAAISGLAGRGVMGHVVQVLDPAEETLPFSGRVRFEGLEAEGTHLINRAEQVREQYMQRLAARRDRLRDLCRPRGWSFTLHHSDAPPQAALLSLYGLMANARD